MPKGVERDALRNSGTAGNQSGQLFGNAGSLYGTLAPALTAEATHPGGYTPTQKAAMNTAAQQSAGGSMSGAVGQGALLAARTRNAGAAQNAIQQAGRQSSENLSDAALRTEMSNANLQQKQQQAGISGLENLYNTDLGGSARALGLSNQALDIARESGGMNNPWNQYGLQYLKNAQSAAAAAAGA